MSDKLADIAEYFIALDSLKLVNRRTYIDGGTRVENSAEHSWHLAMAMKPSECVLNVWKIIMAMLFLSFLNSGKSKKLGVVLRQSY